MKIAIVGAGAVGSAMAQMFPNVVLYDEPKGIGSRDDVNGADIAFICVPTPSRPDGGCDTSIVEEVAGWIDGPIIVIRSTVSVGTTRRLAEAQRKPILFQPEYGPAETPDHPFNELRNIRWIILGGDRKAAKTVARAWKDVYSSDIVIQFTTPEAAELAKYMENAFLAMKVTFCNEFYDLAERFGVEYDELRELWLLDPRMGKTHTFVFPDKRGFGGKCLPKDLAAITRAAEAAGYEPTLLRSIAEANDRFRRASRPARPVQLPIER
jgi:UDPglucose 6-dehydrogenase